MSKVVVTDLQGIRFLLDMEKARELGLVEKEIKSLWKPNAKEKYFFYSDNEIVSGEFSAMKVDNNFRRDIGNIFETEDDCRKAIDHIKRDVSGIVLKFAIENNCLATLEDIRTKYEDLCVIGYNPIFRGYIAYQLKEKEFIPHTVIINDVEKADKIAAILNENSLGLVKQEIEISKGRKSIKSIKVKRED